VNAKVANLSARFATFDPKLLKLLGTKIELVSPVGLEPTTT
jgi:hypothetical protein